MVVVVESNLIIVVLDTPDGCVHSPAAPAAVLIVIKAGLVT